MDHNEFEKIVEEGVSSIPREFLDKLKNVAITISDEPTYEQVQKFHLQHGFTLFGLYEGVPGTRGTGMLPDKITIFRLPILYAARSIEDMREIVKHTVWHEIAHYFGMDERKVRELERKRRERILGQSQDAKKVYNRTK